MSEIELKFLFDEADARALWARVKALGWADGRPNTQTLRSIYLDTAEHALKKAGIALRLRRDGRRWIQTVKTGRQLHGGLSLSGEVEVAVPGGQLNLDLIPDAALRAEIARAVGGASLQTICETAIRRARREFSLENGTRAELAVDIGEILAAGRSAPLCEVEIELLEGDPSGLFDIAQALFPDGGLRFSRLSKSARGYLLDEKGYIDTPLAPQKAGTVKLDPAGTAEQAARATLRECLDQIASNIVVVREIDHPEGPHQLRVGLRRLRSVFSVYASVLNSPEAARIADEAKWLGQEVGRLRDIDVLANGIVRREAGYHPHELELSALADALSRQALEMRKPLRDCLVGARTQKLLIDLARFVETGGWLNREDTDQPERLIAPIGALAEKALRKRWRKVSKRAHGFEALNVNERHELRKELKKLRYGAEFFASLYPAKRVFPFIKRLQKLQTAFGDLNDAAMAKALLTGAETSLAEAPQMQRAAGWVIGASQVRAESSWAGVKLLWQKLEHTRAFWR